MFDRKDEGKEGQEVPAGRQEALNNSRRLCSGDAGALCFLSLTRLLFCLPSPLPRFHLLSRVQHVDIAALLIKYNTCVNATDKWAFTPLHEAAQKGRTQLCALLLAHGADPTMKNQEGQTPLDLATV